LGYLLLRGILLYIDYYTDLCWPGEKSKKDKSIKKEKGRKETQ